MSAVRGSTANLTTRAGPPGHVAEGFGRFSPPDFARFVVIARSSLMESQNHLLDAVDRGHISEQVRLEFNELAEVALQETTGLLECLQSPEALRNARRVRERRQATRDQRRTDRADKEDGERGRGTGNREPEQATRNREPRTRNREPGTENPEPN